MDWSQIWTLVGTLIGVMLVSMGTTISMFLWARSEAREDRHRGESILLAIQQQVNGIQQEMKDFHGQLCTLRAENK